MCDTMVALGSATKDGAVIFAKNSDRQPNEPLLTIRVPRHKHGPGKKLRCTYIEIDQAEETYEVLLLKPSWMWGAEMGGNEFGLNIGNEAVFTREKQGPAALLGMDMLRLALERCRTSREALDLITGLLERYGQGGNCSYEQKFVYHNSFLICDPHSAWVLETAGRYWCAQQVKDIRAISNRLSIGKDFDLCHPDVVKNAVDRGWCKNEADFDFARCYNSPLFTYFSGSGLRSSSALCLLEQERGAITLETMKKVLRSHEKAALGRQFRRHASGSVCMHAGFIFGDHTTGSYAAALKEDRHTYLLSGGSTPCLALYKPFFMVEGEKLTFGEREEEAALAFWLQRERLHRAVLENKVSDLQAYLARRDRIEEEIGRRLAALDADQPAPDAASASATAAISTSANPARPDAVSSVRLKAIMDYALEAEEALLAETLASASTAAAPARIGGSPIFRRYWKKQNARLLADGPAKALWSHRRRAERAALPLPLHPEAEEQTEVLLARQKRPARR